MSRMNKVVLVIAIFLFSGIALGAGEKPGLGEKINPSLGAPEALKLVIVPEGFKLVWKPSPQESEKVTGYQIVRAGFASGPFEIVGTVKKGILEFLDTTASPENIHYYKVRAVADGEFSPFSNTVAGEIPGIVLRDERDR